MTDRRLTKADIKGFSRRWLLGTAVSTVAFSVVAAYDPVFATVPDVDNREDIFLKLSEFLTCKTNLNPKLATRILAALTAEDNDFPQNVLALAKAIEKEKFTDMRGFSGFATKHPDMKPIAMKIISAWYLGYTGDPSENGRPTKDNARFVSYVGALMYAPTGDATVIPTFSRAHPNFWVNPPKTIFTD